MLVAYGPDGRPVVAEETPLAHLQQWSRERVLQCPNCRGIVHVRGGPDKQMQLHFAHQRGECAWSTEAESVRHMRGKVVLAQWLREQGAEAAACDALDAAALRDAVLAARPEAEERVVFCMVNGAAPPR